MSVTCTHSHRRGTPHSDLTKTLSDLTLTCSSCSTPLITLVTTDIQRHRSGCQGFVEGVMFIDRYAELGVMGKVNLFTRCQGFLPLLWLRAAQSIAHYCASLRSSEGKENKGNFPREESAS